MGFKENLKEELSYQGLMIKELAAKAGLNQRSVSNYLRENSSIPAADVAVKIARALGVSVEYLVEGYPPPYILQAQQQISILQLFETLQKSFPK